MSTKGLMEHKKVAEVTIHPDSAGKLAGKAATLTLKSPWLFEGSRGPFTLSNVEHGHNIVRGAYHEDKGPGERKAAAKREEAANPIIQVTGKPIGAATQPLPFLTEANNGRQAGEPIPEPTKPFHVWRTLCVAQDGSHEISGWLRTERKWLDEALAKRILNEMKPFMREGLKYDPFARWYSLEEEAKLPSPWNAKRLELGEPK